MDARPRAAARRPLRLAFHASRIVIDIGVLLILGAMSLPFVEAGGVTRNSITADALPALLLVLPIFAVTLIPDHSRPVPAPLGWASLFLAVIALTYAVVKYLDAETVADTLGGTVGSGARLLPFGTLVVVAGIVIGLARTILRLPSGGTYPAGPHPEEPVPAPRRRATGTAERPRRSSSPTPGFEERSAAPRGEPNPARARRGPAPAQPRRRVAQRRDPVPEGDARAAAPPGRRGQGAPAPQPGRRPAPSPQARSGDPAPRRGEPASPAGEPAPASPPVHPPRARRPVIRPRPEHEALSRPEQPTGEIPLPGMGREVGRRRPADSDPES